MSGPTLVGVLLGSAPSGLPVFLAYCPAHGWGKQGHQAKSRIWPVPVGRFP